MQGWNFETSLKKPALPNQESIIRSVYLVLEWWVNRFA